MNPLPPWFPWHLQITLQLVVQITDFDFFTIVRLTLEWEVLSSWVGPLQSIIDFVALRPYNNFCFYWHWSKLTRNRRETNQDFHQLITVVDAKFQDTNDDTALPEELSTSGWWSSTAGLSAPHRENDCISERCLLKHYRLWNDGPRPGIGPALWRKEGSRRGRSLSSSS